MKIKQNTTSQRTVSASALRDPPAVHVLHEGLRLAQSALVSEVHLRAARREREHRCEAIFNCGLRFLEPRGNVSGYSVRFGMCLRVSTVY